MDFTIKQYSQLLKSLQTAGFFFQTFEQYQIEGQERSLVLRHDVDALPQNSLRFAKIQHSLGIVGTYYFRDVPQSYDVKIIEEIAALGHEVGYHYETMDLTGSKLSEAKPRSKAMRDLKQSAEEEHIDAAYELFCETLDKFRKIVPIKTISMHGSPMSKYDNRDIWKKYDYKELGIIAEPYFDIDFNDLYYITDTGRKWDGHLVNVRDKASKDNPLTNPEFLKLRYHSTQDIIDAVNAGTFPKRAMLNFHPQRWHDKLLPWMKELLWQNTKNVAKYFLIKMRK